MVTKFILLKVRSMKRPVVTLLCSGIHRTANGDWWLRQVCLSVCLSVHMEQLGSHWKDFREISYLVIFRKPVEKIQVSLKSDNNNRYFT